MGALPVRIGRRPGPRPCKSLVDAFKTFLCAAALAALVLFAAGPVKAQLDPARFNQALNHYLEAEAPRATLWNLGFRYFYQYGPTRPNCEVIAETYAQAGDDPAVLAEAARYWRDRCRNWKGFTTAAVNPNPPIPFRQLPPRDRRATLRPYPAGDQAFRPRPDRLWRPPTPRGSDLKMFLPRGD